MLFGRMILCLSFKPRLCQNVNLSVFRHFSSVQGDISGKYTPLQTKPYPYTHNHNSDEALLEILCCLTFV